MICGLYAVANAVRVPLDTVKDKAAEAGMIDKIKRTGSAMAEVKRLTGLFVPFGTDVFANHVNTGTVASWMSYLKTIGARGAVYCVAENGGFHAVSWNHLKGYGDNLHPELNGEFPSKGMLRKVRWLCYF